jgi:thymidylate synthase (FAD)
MAHVDDSEDLYREALDFGIAPEQARLFLPAYSMYIRYRWTVSLAGALNFLDQRLEHDSQFEIREYAKAVRDIVKEQYPITYNAWMDNKND